jgi:carotenoid 1,2-hydratase
MLEVPNAEEPAPPSSIASVGGFSWHYLDLVDAHGNGCVAIWSFGLPFLPGYAHAARTGNAPRADALPSFNLCAYRSGVPDFYVLRAFQPEEVRGDGARWSAPGVEVYTTRTPGRTRVHVAIDLPVTGAGALAGEISVEGPTRANAAPLSDGHPSHSWCPRIGPGTANLSLSCGSWARQIQAPGYLDRNDAPAPLHDLGLQRWTWARAVTADITWIVYVLWPHTGAPTSLVIRIDADGNAVRTPVSDLAITPSRNRWGLRTWSELTAHTALGPVHARRAAGLDASPFYQRDLCAFTTPDGSSTLGFSEHCSPEAVDRWPFRHLVEMCVDRGGSSSMWLPLFSGPASGGARRLIAQVRP